MQRETLHPGWNNLLAWLKGHGMEIDNVLVECHASEGAGYGLYATQHIPRGGLLLKIPPSAMITIKTLTQIYFINAKQPSLNATQLITLHLFRCRPRLGIPSTDSYFGPYLNVLPQSFESHPLSWLIKKSFGIHDGEPLLTLLPLSVSLALEKLALRFESDFSAICAFLMRHLHFLPGTCKTTDINNDPSAVDDYLWAWLNVNTRCVFHRLAAARNDPNNVAMIPIVDFANHTPLDTHLKPAPTDADIWNAAPQGKHGEPFKLLIPPDLSVHPGDQLFLQYGKHANRTLFVEYGFVNVFSETEIADGQFAGEVDMQDLVNARFEARGSIGQWMQKVLIDEGYWGDWTMHASPSPGYPSYRLITALRLLHLVLPSDEIVAEDEVDAFLQPWRDTVLGKAATVSERNEAEWRQTLVELCVQVIERGSVKIEALNCLSTGIPGLEWWASAVGNVEKLWQEEVKVAAAVQSSVKAGIEF